LIKPVLAPFVCAFVIAYLLDPLVDRMTKKFHLSRLAATSLILGLFFTVLIILGIILLPIIYSQFSALIDAIPNYLQTIFNDFYPRIAKHLNRFGFKVAQDFSHLIQDQQINARFVELSKNVFDGAITSSIALINLFSLIFVTPVLIFYLLKDWDILTTKIHDFLPKAISASTQEVTEEVHKTLSSYFRGQVNVCLTLALIYSIFLSFTGLNFGFLIGLVTGLLSFIPYIGMLTGVTMAIVLALLQWGLDLAHIGSVALVFVFGQIIESNFLTPKLIGSKIGLHPVWIIFGLFVFGILLGFIGVLIAVPLTAVCGVIIKYLSHKYKKYFT
jgi:predicted PurR-regulated permease PerM